MELINLYYYTSIPLITCNILFYSLTSLSNSITSSQNVVKFISEHKNCDSIIFSNELFTLDTENKLKIVKYLMFDIVKHHCQTDKEYDDIKNDILNPILEIDDFEVIIMNNHSDIIGRIAEPIRYALMSTLEMAQKLNDVIKNVHIKILKHNKLYLKSFIRLCLKSEIVMINKQSQLLDKRLSLLFDLLKIYLPLLKN